MLLDNNDRRLTDKQNNMYVWSDDLNIYFKLRVFNSINSEEYAACADFKKHYRFNIKFL